MYSTSDRPGGPRSERTDEDEADADAAAPAREDGGRGFQHLGRPAEAGVPERGEGRGLEILAQLGVEGDVAILAGGPAVPGGVSVYSEHLYVCVERSCLSPTFYYRGCERQGDCGAGLDWRNQSVPYARLLELAEPDSALIREMRAHMETVHRTKLRRHGEKGGGE